MQEIIFGIVFSFLGAPGSGKGTLAGLCSKELGFEVLSTGDLCRDHVKLNTELGKKLKVILDAGQLVPDDLMGEMVKDWTLKKTDLKKPIIFDGFPRTVGQVKFLVNFLKSDELGLKFKVVALRILDSTIINRLGSRIICSNKSCQAIYSSLTGSSLRPKKEGTCDTCDSTLIKRDDDKEEVIKERLKVYNSHEGELLDYYKSIGQSIEFLDIEGLSPQEIFEKFKLLLKKIESVS